MLNWHKMTPFPTSYSLATVEEMKLWCRLKKKRCPKIEDSNCGTTVPIGAFIFVVVSDKQEYWDIVDTIIHESVHVFQKTMDYVDEPTVGEETLAYGVASIATNLLKDFHALHDKRET